MGLVQANLVDELPLRKGWADAIVLNEILMYLENSYRLLIQLNQLLKPSGIIYVYNAICMASSLFSGINRIGKRIHRSREAIAFDSRIDWKQAFRASTINFYSFDSLIEEIREVGFEVLDVSGFRIFRNRIRIMLELENLKW